VTEAGDTTRRFVALAIRLGVDQDAAFALWSLEHRQVGRDLFERTWDEAPQSAPVRVPDEQEQP
jgi:hypothetical protein